MFTDLIHILNLWLLTCEASFPHFVASNRSFLLQSIDLWKQWTAVVCLIYQTYQVKCSPVSAERKFLIFQRPCFSRNLCMALFFKHINPHFCKGLFLDKDTYILNTVKLKICLVTSFNRFQYQTLCQMYEFRYLGRYSLHYKCS
jgi:hypothetical protein